MNDNKGSGGDWINPLHLEGDGATRIAGNLTRGAILRRKVASGWALGTFLIEMPTPGVLSSLSLAGFDFVVLEHSPIGFSHLETLIGAGHAAGLVTLVRTWNHDSGLIGKVLDMGAHGVMASHVDSAERARGVVFQAAERIAGIVPRDRALGIYVDDPALCAHWAERRFALQCVSFDGRMFADGARRVAELARHGVRETEGAKQ